MYDISFFIVSFIQGLIIIIKFITNDWHYKQHKLSCLLSLPHYVTRMTSLEVAIRSKVDESQKHHILYIPTF